MDPELDDSDGMDAVDYAVANGATVVCLSQGAYSDVWTDTITLPWGAVSLWLRLRVTPGRYTRPGEQLALPDM